MGYSFTTKVVAFAAIVTAAAAETLAGNTTSSTSSNTGGGVSLEKVAGILAISSAFGFVTSLLSCGSQLLSCYNNCKKERQAAEQDLERNQQYGNPLQNPSVVENHSVCYEQIAASTKARPGSLPLLPVELPAIPTAVLVSVEPSYHETAHPKLKVNSPLVLSPVSVEDYESPVAAQPATLARPLSTQVSQASPQTPPTGTLLTNIAVSDV